MAKKKSNKKSQQQPPMTPGRYMREKAGTLPIDKCYVSPADWEEAGMVNVFVSRKRPAGNTVLSVFLVDTLCLGVKNAFFHENMTETSLNETLRDFRNRLGIKEISYNEAHNIIYGAIAFAEEGGIEPSKNFYPAAYILEDDTDDIPLINYEFGKGGKHLLIIGPDLKEMPYFNLLKKQLGENFDYVMPIGMEVDFEHEQES